MSYLENGKKAAMHLSTPIETIMNMEQVKEMAYNMEIYNNYA